MPSPKSSSHRIWTLAGLAYCLLAPSWPELSKVLGTAVGAAFIVVGAVLVFTLPTLCRALHVAISPLRADWYAALTLGVLLVAVLLVYPHANVHDLNRGSDRDDALLIATNALLHGHFPYHQPTYLGNPVTPLPGALLLAVPFVLIGNIASQNVFWVAAFFLAARMVFADPRPALLVLWSVIAAPSVLHEILVGGDLFANGVYVAVFLVLLTDELRRESPRRGWAVAWAIALGIASSSRLTYPYLFALLFASILRLTSLRTAVVYTGIVVLTFVLVTMPFYMYAPSDFAPLHMTMKLDRVARIVPHPSLIVPALATLCALGVCLVKSTTRTSLLLRSALVVGFPTIVLLIAAFSSRDVPSTEYLGMGLSFTGMATLGFGEPLFSPVPRCAVDPKNV